MNVIAFAIFVAALGCSARAGPKLKWFTSLELGGNVGLVQVSVPHVTKSDVFVTDTFNISVVNRTSGAFDRNIECSENGNCLMFPGGVTVGNFFVIPKWGNLTAYTATGEVVWNITLPCQPSAFQGMVLSEPAPDHSILVTCDSSMDLTLIDGLTGTVLKVGNSSRYEALSRPTFVASKNLWVWSGDLGTAAFSHPSLDRLWLNGDSSYASSPPLVDVLRSKVYVLANANYVIGIDLNSGRTVFATSTMCNSGLFFVPPRWLACNEPAIVNNGHLHVYDALTGMLATNITLRSQCFGGVVAVPKSQDLAAIALCRNLVIANVSTGDIVSTTVVEPLRYDQPLNLGPIVDDVLYCSTAAAVLAIQF